MKDLKLLIVFLVVYVTFIGGGAEARHVEKGANATYPNEEVPKPTEPDGSQSTFHEGRIAITVGCVVVISVVIGFMFLWVFGDYIYRKLKTWFQPPVYV
ncbi:hypothetical protein MAR_018522 [Mya arenaria]|uniref:Transmembrane protein n=1 Tax=Mya arenaria TaxID=6604 RepID=A0ABY7EHD2_MYAAR|nr:hypothetical protein MAR_018522 [Mya arenaria]